MADNYTGVWPRKLSEENIIYGVDWTKRIKSDYIVSQSFTNDDEESAFVLTSVGRIGRLTKVTISGGEPGVVYYVTATITTNTGAVLAERMRLSVL